MKKAIIALVIVAIGIVGYFVWLSDESAHDKPVPVITVMDILTASDLANGVKQAVANGNTDAVGEWLEKGHEVGVEAGLSQKDLAYLESDQAREYVIFNAKRDLFNEAFEKRYQQLKPIDDLKAQYPEASSMFAKADAIIKKRDEIIEKIALTLAEGQGITAQHREAARKLWQERYRARQKKQNTLSNDAG
ncbi:hypothetical protein HHX48_03870 [Salinimonas sp. HHU 13199]|uniref:Uncharacterized protein n=1 Tax=Salinimonas profundi TaxID=2729140 RepID=A0ABR8LH85_9ALTE|nr:hypothetical protein [Salinimonas profundi]MBD3584873.1 hypothetical protein [Salinimonas profundi]